MDTLTLDPSRPRNDAGGRSAAYVRAIFDREIARSDLPMALALAGCWPTAVLYAVTANGAFIGLPEDAESPSGNSRRFAGVIEMEVDRVLKNEAIKATATLRKNVDLLRQLSGHQDIYHPVPTEKAIDEGIARRWEELAGVLVRAPFTFEQAQSALLRILNHTPPSGENNEQFRDCCIWASVLDFSVSRVVHFVTNDTAFYQARDRVTLAMSLQGELRSLGREVRIYRTN